MESWEAENMDSVVLVAIIIPIPARIHEDFKCAVR